MVKIRLIPDNVLLEPCGISQQPPTIILTDAFFLLIIPCNWQSLGFFLQLWGFFPVLFVVLPSVHCLLFAWQDWLLIFHFQLDGGHLLF